MRIPWISGKKISKNLEIQGVFWLLHSSPDRITLSDLAEPFGGGYRPRAGDFTAWKTRNTK
jgi:hypothetical protein